MRFIIRNSIAEEKQAFRRSGKYRMNMVLSTLVMARVVPRWTYVKVDDLSRNDVSLLEI
jgi:hypothetical protein